MGDWSPKREREKKKVSSCQIFFNRVERIQNHHTHKSKMSIQSYFDNAEVTEKNLKEVKETILSEMYSVPIRCLSETEFGMHCRNLTMTPIEANFGPQNNEEKSSFPAYMVEFGRLHVPRFYGLEKWGKPEKDERIDGEDVNLPFHGELGQIQNEAMSAALENLNSFKAGCMLCLPCGFGKTVCALYGISKVSKKTLVIVNKEFLVSQWKERIKQFVPDARIGTIQRNVADVDADIVVAMVHSLAKRDYPSSILGGFGLVVLDEAHHMSAPFFSKALRKLKSKRILALSATPERRDGLTCLLYWSMGEICFRTERKHENTLVSFMLYEGGPRKEIAYRDGRLAIPLMLNALVKDVNRNACIADHISRYVFASRRIIVLTDRLMQLEHLHTLLCARGVTKEDMMFYVAKTKNEVRETAPKKRVILSTYCMAKEGLDIPHLDTLIMATPKGDITQAIGRIQREHPTKKTPLIVDIVDTFSFYDGLRWKRNKLYKNQEYKCQTYDITNDDNVWFV